VKSVYIGEGMEEKRESAYWVACLRFGWILARLEFREYGWHGVFKAIFMLSIARVAFLHLFPDSRGQASDWREIERNRDDQEIHSSRT
jgi:hypothetical protein